MKAPVTPAAEAQADALVNEIQRQLAERERELLDAAAVEAEATRQRARIKARRQMRRAVEDLRASEQQRTLRLRAELETTARRQASAQAQRALALAWPQLASALIRRWNDPAARQRWMQAQLAQARPRLTAPGWVLHHPAAWRDAETAQLRSELHQLGVADATLRAEAQLSIGLVIEADGVRLDSTPAALLADRSRVEAALLAALDAVAS